MKGRIRATARKEFRQIFRDIRSLGLLFFLPLFLLVLFGYAISLDVTGIALGIYDQDRSPESRKLREAFTTTEYFTLAAWMNDPSQIDRHILDDSIEAAVIIPADFSEALVSGREAVVQVLIDGTNSSTAAAISGYVEAIVSGYSPSLRADRLQAPVDIRSRVWYNPELESTRFLLPGLISMILVITAVISTSLSIVREKERGTMEQIVVSPVGPLELIMGKALPYCAISLAVTVVILLCSYFLFGISVAGSYLLLFLVSLVFLFSCLGLGILISTIAETQQVAFLIASIATLLPTFVLSGFVFPIRNMPLPIQAATFLIPARYYLVALRAIMIKGVGLEAFWQELLLLSVFAGGTLGASMIRLRKGGI